MGTTELNRQFIGGAWADAATGATRDLVNPATEDAIGAIAHGGAADAAAAIEAAHDAFEAWAARGPWARAEILLRAADLMAERAPLLGTITSEESGKPIREAVAEWASAPNYLRFAAEEAKRIGGRIIPSRVPGRRIEVTYAPIGVVGVIAAWNFPVYNVNRAASSALAAGCTVVVRPSEHTPRSALAYASILAEAGAPAGVVNVVLGDAAAMAATMLDDPRLRKLQFTGSSGVGKRLMEGAARTVTRLSLELGGNAPVIVMPDVADVAAVAAGAVGAKYRNAGQVCIAPQRFLVHESIAGEFEAAVADRTAALAVGDPSLETTDIGPIISSRQRDAVERIVDESVGLGAAVRAGGRRIDGKGFFFEPTVLSSTPPDAPAMTEEIFGPVLPVTTFTDVADAIAVANSVELGLTAFVWTTDLRTAFSVSDALEYGMVGINDWYPVTAEAPFGGVKASGLGRESGSEGVLEYLESKTRYFGGVT